LKIRFVFEKNPALPTHKARSEMNDLAVSIQTPPLGEGTVAVGGILALEGGFNTTGRVALLSLFILDLQTQFSDYARNKYSLVIKDCIS
jgi:hypothetical protein